MRGANDKFPQMYSGRLLYLLDESRQMFMEIPRYYGTEADVLFTVNLQKESNLTSYNTWNMIQCPLNPESNVLNMVPYLKRWPFFAANLVTEDKTRTTVLYAHHLTDLVSINKNGRADEYFWLMNLDAYRIHVFTFSGAKFNAMEVIQEYLYSFARIFDENLTLAYDFEDRQYELE